MAIIQGTKVEITVGGQTLDMSELTVPPETPCVPMEPIVFTCQLKPIEVGKVEAIRQAVSREILRTMLLPAELAEGNQDSASMVSRCNADEMRKYIEDRLREAWNQRIEPRVIPRQSVTLDMVISADMGKKISAFFWGQKIIKIKPRWRRLEPGVWVKWSGWYAKDTRTGEVSPVLCMVERQPLKGVCGRDRNLYAATLEWHGGKIYGRTHWDWKVARESTEDRDFGAWNWFEFYREGEGK